MAVRVTERSLDWALVHAERYGDTDIFPIPFEFEAMRHSWDSLRESLSRKDLDVRPVEELRRCIAPKGLYAYRVVTQLDPVDFIFYTALAYEIGEDLERHRVAARENVVHSSRFLPSEDGNMFDREYGYSSFIDTCRRLASDGSSDYVVVADIADFYPRIYLHRIESALELATREVDKRRGVMKLLKQWNDRVSYGIPVGSAASRLIAEATLNDVDQYLLSEDTTYCRYSDDFRIFCKDRAEAYSKLEKLATVLYENHGLFLQPGKTEILNVGQFGEKYLQTYATTELARLREKFGEIIDRIGVENAYDELEYDEFDDDLKELVDSLNLSGLLEEQLSKETVDTGVFRFVLRRLGQLGLSAGTDLVLENIEKCYHLVPAIVAYLREIAGVDEDFGDDVGGEVMSAVFNSHVFGLPFNRCWALSLFSDGSMQCRVPDLTRVLHDAEPFSQRKAILGLGRMGQYSWFRSQKSSAMHFGPWSKRAFIAASSCMARDEVRVWHESIRSRLDELENAVVDWVRERPL